MKSGEIRATAIFILVCFLFSWPIFFIVDGWLIPMFREQANIGGMRLTVSFGHMLAMCGPALAAIFMWRVYHKRALPAWRWSQPRYYVFAALAMLVLWTVPGLIGLALGDQIDAPEWYDYIMLFNMFTLLWVAGTGEEVGWCTYLLPLLLPRFGRLRAAVISGFIRGVWHWPVFFAPMLAQSITGEKPWLETIVSGVFLLLSLGLSNILFSGVLGWVWYRTESIPLVGWLHQWYDLARDATGLLLVLYGSWAGSLGIVFMLAGLVGLFLIYREEKKIAAQNPVAMLA
jgi:membrane protease YdiL (CAAX protease family)